MGIYKTGFPPMKDGWFDIWCIESACAINNELGPAYSSRFSSATGITIELDNSEDVDGKREIFYGIRVRIARLHEFIKELGHNEI
jgi:hypothetical protein